MEKRFEVLPPTMPNFVRFKHKAALKQDGFKVDNGFPIEDFTEAEALEYAELMKQEFIKHYNKKRNDKHN